MGSVRKVSLVLNLRLASDPNHTDSLSFTQTCTLEPDSHRLAQIRLVREERGQEAEGSTSPCRRGIILTWPSHGHTNQYGDFAISSWEPLSPKKANLKARPSGLQTGCRRCTAHFFFLPMLQKLKDLTKETPSCLICKPGDASMRTKHMIL